MALEFEQLGPVGGRRQTVASDRGERHPVVTIPARSAASVAERRQQRETFAFDTEHLYRRYGPMVLRRCQRLLRDPEKAADAMHDVFVEVLRRKEALVADAPSALLLRAATNACLNRLRSERRKPQDKDDELLLRIASTEEPQARPDARSLLRRILGAEKESTGTIAVLHLLDGLTLEEVAAEVGLSVSSVRKRLRSLKARAINLAEEPESIQTSL